VCNLARPIYDKAELISFKLERIRCWLAPVGSRCWIVRIMRANNTVPYLFNTE
jgi:hypothetical protein